LAPRRYYRNLAAHDAGIAQASSVHAFPDVHRGTQVDDDGVGGEGRNLDLPRDMPEAQHPHAALTLAVARGNGLDGPYHRYPFGSVSGLS
jgi:hypothetical protein